MKAILESNVFRRDFNPEENIKTCAHLIQQQLGLLNEEEISALKGGKLSHELRNHKKILKLLIRIASESHDHLRTVDFISEEAANYLKEQCEGKLFNKHLKSGISHEHVVPCEAVYQKILGKSPPEILKILEALSFRALVLPKERKALDQGKYKSEMPAGWDTDGSYAVLARYRRSEIDGQLHAISTRGAALLEAWKKQASHKDTHR